MKPSAVKKALAVCLNGGRSAFLWGAPGVGKSDTVLQLAVELYGEKLGYTMEGSKVRGPDGKLIARTNLPFFRDIRATLLDPVDLRGIPSINNGRALWCAPSFLPDSGEGILLLDELNSAPKATQAACYQLALDGALGEYLLPEGWHIVAAGNRDGDKGVTHQMPAPLANRFVHIQFDADLQDWSRWAIGAGIETVLIAFLRTCPDLFHRQDTARNDKAFPTPRSWAAVSDLLKAGVPRDIEHDLLSGVVGEGEAAQLLGFIRIWRELPSAESILLNPQTAVIPDDPSIMIAICCSLSPH